MCVFDIIYYRELAGTKDIWWLYIICIVRLVGFANLEPKKTQFPILYLRSTHIAMENTHI